MQNPLEFYQKEKQLFEVLFSKVKKQLTTYSICFYCNSIWSLFLFW